MMRACGLALFVALVGCSQDRGTEDPPVPDFAGTWSSDAGEVEFRMSDSALVAAKGTLPVTAEAIWLAGDGKIFQVLRIDYIRLQLSRAQNPIGYAGSAWTLALLGAAVQVYKYSNDGQALCLESGSFKRCFSR